ncbi:MED7 protein-domain-containing protein, partial [Chytriomyces sp. MP71]
MGCEQLFADEDSPNFGINRSLSLVLVFIAFIASLPSDPWFATMPPSTEDRATELKKLNHSLLLNFLELQHILVNRPQDFTTKIEHIRILFINMHYLLNGYRPHQARDTLKLLMELQIHRRISMAREIQQLSSRPNSSAFR